MLQIRSKLQKSYIRKGKCRTATTTPTQSRSGQPPWILIRGGLESSGRRLISSMGKIKRIAFFFCKILYFFKMFSFFLLKKKYFFFKFFLIFVFFERKKITVHNFFFKCIFCVFWIFFWILSICVVFFFNFLDF